jgi:PAS domain-containing protein
MSDKDPIVKRGLMPPYIQVGMRLIVGGRSVRVVDVREDDSDQWRGATVADLAYHRSSDTSTAACSWLRAEATMADDFDPNLPDAPESCDECGAIIGGNPRCDACCGWTREDARARSRSADDEPSEDPREVGYQAPVASDHLIPSAPPSPTGGPMLSREATAIELLRCAISWEPEVRLVGNLRACEIAALAASIVTCCPKCGAEPWVNIDCDLCLVATALTAGEVP